jgi:hypothetical protein
MDGIHQYLLLYGIWNLYQYCIDYFMRLPLSRKDFGGKAGYGRSLEVLPYHCGESSDLVRLYFRSEILRKGYYHPFGVSAMTNNPMTYFFITFWLGYFP